MTAAPASIQPSQAVILAGGQGTRLRPLTLTRPKPVVPLLNRPFLAYQLALLARHGVTDVILSCSYRVDDVRAAMGDGSAFGVRLRYVVEDEPLGTGGGVRNAADLARGHVFVLNGDVLTDVDLSAMRRFHESSGSRTTIFLIRVADPRAYGLVETAADGRLLAFREKPQQDEEITTDTINAGVYLIDASLLGRMPADRPVSIEREFFPALIADGIPSFGWNADVYWRDIGSPAAYLAAHVELLERRLHTTLTPPGKADGESWIGANVRIDAGAVVVPPCVIGDGVTIGAASRVGPLAVLGDGSRIGPRAHVTRSVLWDAVDVGADATVDGCVAGTRARIRSGGKLGPGTVVAAGAVAPAAGDVPV